MERITAAIFCIAWFGLFLTASIELAAHMKGW